MAKKVYLVTFDSHDDSLESYATGKYIISANRQMAKHTFDYAKQLGYTIPYPLTPIDLYHQGYNLISRDEGIIIDDVEMVLSSLLSRPIETITFNSRDLQFSEDRYIEELTELKKELNCSGNNYRSVKTHVWIP